MNDDKNNKFASTFHRNGVISIFLAVPFVSLTGLFAKWITLSPIMIVQWRTIFAFIALSLFLIITRKNFFLKNPLDFLWFFFGGFLLGGHWIAFFKSIQVSTVAIGLLSYVSYPIFTSMMEPLFFPDSKIRKIFFPSILVLCGLVLISTSKGDFEEIISGSILEGVMWGLLAGLGFAILTLLNRLLVRDKSPLLLTCWQNGFAALIIIPWSFSDSWIITEKDWILLFILGVICTVGGHSLLINGLRYIRAQLASLLIAGLEPFVAIFFAFLFLGEIPNLRTIIGGIFILGSTVILIKKDV